MCAQRRLRSARASLCAQWVAKDPVFLHAESEDSDQTGRMYLDFFLIFPLEFKSECTTYIPYVSTLQQNIQHEIDRKSSVIEDSQHNGDVDSSEQSTEQSDHSEEQGHVTDPTGNWQRFAQTKFQVKASHSYCCAALQQPLLPKRDKSDHLVSVVMRLWYFSSSVNSFFKRACAAIHWGYMSDFWSDPSSTSIFKRKVCRIKSTMSLTIVKRNMLFKRFKF